MKKNSNSPQKPHFRLQGTDGIRSDARLATPDEKKEPLKVFLEQKIITPEFMELYTYAWVRSIIIKKPKIKNPAIVLGWDPRDKDTKFAEAVIKGIRKAGANAISLGIVPTPLVPIYLLYCQAQGGIMITASHNPKDQNGIKLFSSYRGMKPLPQNDINLSQSVCSLNYQEISKIKLQGQKIDHRNQALKLFSKFCLDPKNSWVERVSFRDIILVVDCANGSLSGIAAEIFKEAGFGEIFEFNSKLDGNVNQNSGVADLEGYSLITPAMIREEIGIFSKHPAILAMFELGRKNTKQIMDGKIKISGAIFDADGDRFFRLEYQPLKDSLIVQSGDDTSWLQAHYLMKRKPNRFKGSQIINTVESDLNAFNELQEQGFKVRVAPVGDKWILCRSTMADIKIRLDYIEANWKATSEKNSKKFEQAKKQLEEFENSGVSEIEQLEKLEKIVNDLISSQKIDLNDIYRPDMHEIFAIGAEVTGHVITSGQVSGKNNEIIPIYCGNGLKNALNTFVASKHIGLTLRAWYNRMENPFKPGYKQTNYAYYIDKKLFFKNSTMWKQIKSLVESTVKELGWECKQTEFPEDHDMLYLNLSVISPTGNLDQASIFIRNSGTENKIGVNIRGAKRLKKHLGQLGETITRQLMSGMKDSENEFCQMEWETVNNLYGQKIPEEEILVAPDKRSRLLTEMKKQQFIELTGRGYGLTQRGKWYVEKHAK